jgi:Asp-tRNA(Asn)/Glu-tRNA(Gln) amidotransferase A subunit family amidase|eukprot:COSAG06_NODE_157_length_21766_cov_172.214335_11_plen_251_part_00
MQALRSLFGGAAEPEDEDERLTPYTHSVDYPPREIGHDPAACEAWYHEVFGSIAPLEADPSATPRENELARLSASEYIEMRKTGGVSCEEYAMALVKRATYYRYMNQWIYTSYDRFEKTVAAAAALDARAAAEGVESIAPLYGLCIPMKGTAAVVDFPAGSGVGVLSGYTPKQDSELTLLIKERNGVIFGCTNVPEFAANWVTANPASGHTRNPYNHAFTVGGSSGGSASAVASYMCPIAVTEDTGGSTR